MELLKGNETSVHVGLLKDLYENVHGNIIQNSQKMQAVQMSSKWEMDKQNVAHLYNTILLSNKLK